MCLIEIASKLESINDTSIKENNDVEVEIRKYRIYFIRIYIVLLHKNINYPH